VDLEEWMSAEPQEFSIESKGLEASGSASLRADEQGARVINLRHLAIGKTDVNGSILIKPHFSEGTKHKGEYAYEVLVRGDRLDAKPIIEFIKKTKDKSKLGDKGKGGRGQDIKIPPIKIDAKVGQLLIGDDEEKIENISGVMTHGGKVWESVVTYGEISGKPIVLRLTPKEGDDEGGGTRRELILNSEDAGSTLRALDLYRSMKGGKLKLKADISDGLTEGKLVIKDCVILDAPILTKMFTLASFTGLANLIAGEGIRFDKLKARFNKSHDQIEIDGATAWGSNIGITVERGYVDLEGDSMEFEGLLIPAYTLNKFLNKIPLIGKLITGGKGSGILAANYTVRGPVRDPEISVNPLSVLTPGILRIFVNALKEAVPEAGEPVDEEKTTTQP
ncbi:MAG: AsmA-like C-terminal domain-containing protein, partial [Waddliaceae bacterium]